MSSSGLTCMSPMCIVILLCSSNPLEILDVHPSTCQHNTQVSHKWCHAILFSGIFMTLEFLLIYMFCTYGGDVGL